MSRIFILMFFVLISIKSFSGERLFFDNIGGIKLDYKKDIGEKCHKVINNKSFRGCCSHHKGILQCGLGMIITNKIGHLKCVDGTFSKTCTAY